VVIAVPDGVGAPLARENAQSEAQSNENVEGGYVIAYRLPD